jgi:acyl-protein synthetase LuxE
MNSELSSFAARLRELIQRYKSLAGEQILPEGFNSLALELFTLQFKHNSAYRKICEARKLTPPIVKHWKQIPVVPTAAFRELELTCLPPHAHTVIFHSSGTDGHKPSRHFHNAESLAVYEASLWQWFQQNVLADSQFTIHNSRVIFLTPPPVQTPHSSLVHMFEIVRQKSGLFESAFAGQISANGAWMVDFAATVQKIKDACDAGTPLTVLGTAFSLVHLLDFLAENNLRFQSPEDSRVMETGGYKNRSRTMPKSELHAFITKRIGIPSGNIICEYGMGELSSQAYDFKIQNSRRQFRFPPWARVQIVSPETGHEVCDGEPGLIRVFDLANVFSVAAIQTEDLGIRRGDGFELIGRAQFAAPRGCSLMTA